MLITLINPGHKRNKISKWAMLPIWIFVFSTVSAQSNLVINGDLEDKRKVPVPKNMAIDGIRLEIEEDSSYFQPLIGEHSPLGTIAAPGWQYTTYDSVKFSASYSGVGYSHSGTNFKLLMVYRGSQKGNDAHVSNAVASLCRPLLPGKQYKVSFYIKPFSGTAFTNNIGVAFSNEKIPYHFHFPQEHPNESKKAKKERPKQLTIKADYKLTQILEDTTGYTLITFTYTAKGGEGYVYIGNLFFETDDFWRKSSWKKTPHFGYEGHNSRFFVCYYALDDLQVQPLDTNEILCQVTDASLSTAASPDTICLGSYYYETDSAITNEDFSLLTEEINKAPDGYEVIVIGHTDHEGTPEHNLKLSLMRAEQIKLTIIEAVSKPISAIGLGSEAPLYRGAHSSKNRRVDVCLVKVEGK